MIHRQLCLYCTESIFVTGLQADDSRWHMYTMSYNGSYVSVYQDSQLTAGDDLTGSYYLQCSMNTIT